MTTKLKIRTVILLLLLFLIIVRFQMVSDGLELFYYLILDLFAKPSDTISQLDYQTIDLLASVLLVLLLPILLIAFKDRLKILHNKITIISFFIIIISINFIFAPLITDSHPNYQYDIKVARFLPPLAQIQKLYLVSSSDEINISQFAKVKNKVINSPVNRTAIFADSVKVKGDSVAINSGTQIKIIALKSLKNENSKLISETKTFIFGTDELGRDIFSRVIYGSRISIFIGILAVAVALILGILFGFIAGYFGGYFDLVISRITDMFLTVPSIFFVVMALAFFGNSLFSIIIVLGFSGWMSLFKVVKGEIAVIKTKDYFITSKKMKLSKSKIVLKEILPVMIIPVIVNVVFQFSNVILAESSLSYLGLGSGLNYPSWGSMILSGQHYMSQGWWMMFFPGIILIVTLLTFNLFGEKIKSIYNQGDNYL